MIDDAQFLERTMRLPCPSCGNQLRFSAASQQLSCAYCGYEEAIDRAKDLVIEQSLAEAAAKAKGFKPESIDQKVFDCQNCGAKFMVEAEDVHITCGFCGSQNVNLEAYDHQYIQPIGIVPFYVSRREANDQFARWIKRGWFHPNKLKQLSRIENLHGIYIPFWTYDAETESDWKGEAGFYYYETKRVRVNGKMQTKQVRKTRWKWRAGHLSHFFDDVLVVASGALEQPDMERILPYHLTEVVNFDPRFMAGWETEIYSLEVDKGYQVADQIMDHKIRNMCSAQLGGDTQRNLRVSSQKYNQTFKHVILPLWICAYTFRNKTYRFYINGQTGKVSGDKPLSWIKIVLVVLLLALIGLTLYLLKNKA